MKSVVTLLLVVQMADAAFSLKDEGNAFTVDCESDPEVVIQVNRTNGNLQSIRVDGTQLQTNPRGSHINSGFGNGAHVTAKTVGEDRILITVTNEAVTHYYAFRKGQPNVFMATWADRCPHPGEMRFIARLDAKTLNKGNVDRPGDNTTDKAIESKDIFIQRDGLTQSKYYSGVKFIDDDIHGSRGSNIGAYFAIGSHESSSGGPFFRDINSQTAGPTEEIYFYMFSGHSQTEPFRKGQLHGPYALCFTKGPPPAMPAMGWMRDLDLKGWVAERGRVSGTTSGLMKDVKYTVYLSNDVAQYWTRVQPDGAFTTSSMKPGNYTIRLMRNELAVASSTITVGTGTVSTRLVEPGLPEYLWRLGLPDGTPDGFLNADKMGDMHPSDKRLARWGPVTLPVKETVPTNLGDFPAAQWADVNNGNKIGFRLGGNEVMDRVLEIGVTVSQYGSRPVIKVNDKWSSKAPGPPRSYDSRSITFGIYRGYDHVFSIPIPRSAFKSGTNTISIWNVSGSGSGGFLSNAFVFDYIGLRD